MEMTNKDTILISLLESTLDTFILNYRSLRKTNTRYGTNYFVIDLLYGDKISGYSCVDGSLKIKLQSGKHIDSITYYSDVATFIHTILPENANYFKKRTQRRTISGYREINTNEHYFQESTINNNLLPFDVVMKLNTVLDYITEIKKDENT